MLRCPISTSHQVDTSHEADRATSDGGLGIQKTLHKIRHRGRVRRGGQPERVVSLPGIFVHRDSITRHPVERVSGGGDFLRNG